MSDIFAVGPLLILFIGALLLLLVDNIKAVSVSTFGALIGAALCAVMAPASTSTLLTPWLAFDKLSLFFTLLFLGIGVGVHLIGEKKAEFSFFLLSSIFGLILIAMARDYLTLFLGLETLSISLYVLCSFIKTSPTGAEAAFKYFLLGSVSTAILLFGIALIYGATGTTKLIMPPQVDSLFLAGAGLVTVSLLFKAAIFPFHIWAPDVYAGAPISVTALMAAGTKAGAFAAFVRIFMMSYSSLDQSLLAIAIFPTLIFANFVAMQQTELRRFFAYSSISHAGFLLIPIASGGPDALSSMLFYLVVYALATLGCFACLTFVEPTLDGVKGLFSSSPVLACCFSFCLLTLGGIPPSIGFFAKFYLLKAAFGQGYIALVILGLLTTIFAAFYYLRIVAALFAEPKTAQRSVVGGGAVASFIATSALIALTIYPEPLLTILVAIK